MHTRAPSKNERVRRELVDRINRENQAMVRRLESMAPIISSSKLEEDFGKHLHISQNLRRRRKILNSLTSPKRDTPATNEDKLPLETSLSPIKTVSEFRAAVISKKKLESRPEFQAAVTPAKEYPKNSSAGFLAQFENLPGMKVSDIRYGIVHDPNSKQR